MKLTDLTPGTAIKVGGKKFIVAACDDFHDGKWTRQPTNRTSFWLSTPRAGNPARMFGGVARAKVVPIATMNPKPIVEGRITLA